MKVTYFAVGIVLLFSIALVSADQITSPKVIEAAQLESNPTTIVKPQVHESESLPIDESNSDIHHFTNLIRMREIRQDAETDRELQLLHKRMSQEKKEVDEVLSHEVPKFNDHEEVHEQEPEEAAPEPEPVQEQPSEPTQEEYRFRAAPTPIEPKFREEIKKPSPSSGSIDDIEGEGVNAIRNTLAQFRSELHSGQIPMADVSGVEQQIELLENELRQAESRMEATGEQAPTRLATRPGLHLDSYISKLSHLQRMESASPYGLRTLSLRQLRSLEHSLRALLPVLRAYHHRTLLYKKIQHAKEIDRLTAMEEEIRRQKQMIARRSQLELGTQDNWSSYSPLNGGNPYMTQLAYATTYNPCQQQATQFCSPQTVTCNQACSQPTCYSSCQQAHLVCVTQHVSSCSGVPSGLPSNGIIEPSLVPAGSLSQTVAQPRFEQVSQKQQEQEHEQEHENNDYKQLLMEEEKQKQTLQKQADILDRLENMKSNDNVEEYSFAEKHHKKHPHKHRHISIGKEDNLDTKNMDDFVDAAKEQAEDESMRFASANPLGSFTSTPLQLNTPIISTAVKAPKEDNYQPTGFPAPHALSAGTVDAVINTPTTGKALNAHPSFTYTIPTTTSCVSTNSCNDVPSGAKTVATAPSSSGSASASSSASNAAVNKLVNQAYTGNVKV